MALIAKKVESGFEQCPSGTFVGRCVWLIDLGTQTTTYQGKTKNQPKILIGFELPTELMQDGRPFVVSERFTNALHEKSNLQIMLESWRGQKLTDQEQAEFDLTKVVGKECMVSIIHNISKDKTYANISSVAKLMKGVECPKQVNESLIFDIGEIKTPKFEKLPEWIRNIINKSAEVSGNYAPGEDSENPAEGQDGPAW